MKNEKEFVKDITNIDETLWICYMGKYTKICRQKV